MKQTNKIAEMWWGSKGAGVSDYADFLGKIHDGDWESGEGVHGDPSPAQLWDQAKKARDDWWGGLFGGGHDD